MRSTLIVAFLAAAGFATAAVVPEATDARLIARAKGKRAAAQNNLQNNLAVDTKKAASNPALTALQFAFLLERMETEYYTEGLKKFAEADFQKVGYGKAQTKAIIQTLSVVRDDEKNHTEFIDKAIKSLSGNTDALKKCTFDFGPALESPLNFIGAARLVEAAGVGAYLGAAPLLVNQTDALVAAASILTVEARHQSILNVFSGATYETASFDLPLSPPQVLSLAAGFIKGCTPADLGLTSNAPLNVTDSKTNSSVIQIGSKLNFLSSNATDITANGTATCQMLVPGAKEAIALPSNASVVPAGVDGLVAVFLTRSSTPLSGTLSKQNESDIIAGPALIFVDSVNTVLGKTFKPVLIKDELKGIASKVEEKVGGKKTVT